MSSGSGVVGGGGTDPHGTCLCCRKTILGGDLGVSGLQPPPCQSLCPPLGALWPGHTEASPLAHYHQPVHLGWEEGTWQVRFEALPRMTRSRPQLTKSSHLRTKKKYRGDDSVKKRREAQSVGAFLQAGFLDHSVDLRPES